MYCTTPYLSCTLFTWHNTRSSHLLFFFSLSGIQYVIDFLLFFSVNYNGWSKIIMSTIKKIGQSFLEYVVVEYIVNIY